MTLRTYEPRGTKNPNYLNIAEFSDVHLGHGRTPNEWIIAGLQNAFPDNPETGDLDLIIIAGDTFDQLITLPDNVVSEITIWVIEFLKLCKKYDICLRILEGTPSHDRKQSYVFEHQNSLHSIGADVRWVKQLEVERLERFNTSILYIPDEWNIDNLETYQQAVQAITAAGLTYVDFAVMHGAFEHQYPPHLKLPTHDSSLYLNIVTQYIFIGHVHYHSVFDRIIAAGSFDRLAFGEEQPKGHVRIKVRGKGPATDEFRFIENTRAKLYTTVDVTGQDLEGVLALLNGLSAYPSGSGIRLQCSKGDVAAFAIKELRSTYPHWTLELKHPKLATAPSMSDPLAPKRQFSSVTLAKDNVKRLLDQRLAATTDLTPEQITETLSLLDGLL